MANEPRRRWVIAAVGLSVLVALIASLAPLGPVHAVLPGFEKGDPVEVSAPAGAVASGSASPAAPIERQASAETQAALRVELEQGAELARSTGAAGVEVQVLAPSLAAMDRVAETIRQTGGTVGFTHPGLRYLQAQIRPDAISDLLASGGGSLVAPNWAARVLGAEDGAPSPLRPADLDPVSAAAARTGFGLNLGAVHARADSLAGGLPSEPGSGAPHPGSGVTVAIIDSGIDPGHPDLQVTPDGRRKLLDFQDFTGEGEVPTPETVAAADGDRLTTSLGTYRSPPGQFVGPFRFGVLREARLGGPVGLDMDFDHNGRRTDEYGVLVAASAPGRYDTVFIDSRREFDFSTATPLQVFAAGGQVEWVGRPLPGAGGDSRTPVVVASMAADGSRVVLGFDGFGHGTHVAGVVAASGPGMTGLAPGAQLIAIKALGSNGQGDWFRLVQAMDYAARAGARVINLSIEDLQAAAGGQTAAAAVLRRLADDLGVLLVLAAGNSGPGAGSSLAPGDVDRVLTVGGYYSPETWFRDFGYTLPLEGLWPRSGAGPRADGSLVPSVVAPASAPAPAPRWLSASGYILRTGTSVAAPHAAGAAAVLIGAAGNAGRVVDPGMVVRALQMGARTLQGYQHFEQGYGLIDVEQAWFHLQRLPPVLALTALGADGGQGLFAREYQPGRTTFTLYNLGESLQAFVVSNVDWVQPEANDLFVPARSSRTFGVNLRPPQTPGIHTAVLTVRVPGRYGYDLQVPVTVVTPHPLDAKGSLSLQESGLAAGRYRRYYFRVPVGSHHLDLGVQVPRGLDGQPRGRVQAYLFRPDGEEVFRSATLGTGSSAGAVATARVPQPITGTWELLVRSDAELVRLGNWPVSDFAIDLTVAAARATSTDGTGVAAAPSDGPGVSLPNPAGVTDPPALTFVFPKGGFTANTDITITTPLAFTGSVSGWGPAAQLANAGRAGIFTMGGQVERLEVRDFIPLARFAVTPLAASPALGLSLYRFSPGTRNLELFARAPAEGDSQGLLEVRNLPPGTYSVYVDTRGGNLWSVRYAYRRQYLGAGGLRPQDTPKARMAGESWTVPTAIDVPTAPGHYTSHLLLTDAATGQGIVALPVVIKVGQPELAARILEPYWVSGRSGVATVELHDAATGQPWRGTATIRGLRYQVDNGRATVLLPAGTEPTPLAVAVYTTRFAPLHLERRLTPRPAPGVAPLGVAPPAQEWPEWRRKVLSELRQSLGSAEANPGSPLR